MNIVDIVDQSEFLVLSLASIALNSSRHNSNKGIGNYRDYERFDRLRRSNNLEQIEKAVYSDNIYENQCIVRNNNLTEEQCRHLATRLAKDDDLSWTLLVYQKNFPKDLLLFVAHQAGEMTQSSILSKTNIPLEVKVTITLKKMGS